VVVDGDGEESVSASRSRSSDFGCCYADHGRRTAALVSGATGLTNVSRAEKSIDKRN
jgi:hypothetical protein